ncbi:hypothetical protein T552_02343 [Pneumocystis carinii B80]|uniref:Protein kinase domain-containing protein n=1 Tax=Pneumocystis carinii (strain B80) TaxID=1408658 RepID=A0A0W4ZG89_PNEC8|nr:hypothetical protein T552_02343 [Pneumocystis carinii B80]KTW27364.1 hypothetical protein T552_02343 [Pneumocystis carinii B80]
MTNNGSEKSKEKTWRRSSSASDEHILLLRDGWRGFGSFKSFLKEELEVFFGDDDSTRMVSKYDIREEIGHGSFGSVNRCIDVLTGKEYAIKEFSKVQLRKVYGNSRLSHSRCESDSFIYNNDISLYRHIKNNYEENNPFFYIRKEIDIMKKINHRNIVNMIDALDDPNGDSLYIVLEMCEKGVLMDLGMNKTATPYSETECRKWFRDLMLGVEYLHANGICHCDIKPENLLLSKDGTLKITDFSISKMFTRDDSFRKIKGTPAFMAPELCFSDGNIVSGKAADIWSMGITLWCLIFGCLPFYDSDIIKLYNMIKTKEIIIPQYVAPSLKDLFQKILEKIPEKRIKLHDLRKHNWITQDGLDPLITYEENILGSTQNSTCNFDSSSLLKKKN